MGGELSKISSNAKAKKAARNAGVGPVRKPSTNGNDVKQSRTASDGNHAHSVYADIAPFESAHWGGGRPRWYALCFIMKLY